MLIIPPSMLFHHNGGGDNAPTWAKILLGVLCLLILVEVVYCLGIALDWWPLP